jgi:hypothetical protein
VVVAEL